MRGAEWAKLWCDPFDDPFDDLRPADGESRRRGETPVEKI